MDSAKPHPLESDEKPGLRRDAPRFAGRALRGTSAGNLFAKARERAGKSGGGRGKTTVDAATLLRYRIVDVTTSYVDSDDWPLGQGLESKAYHRLYMEKKGPLEMQVSNRSLAVEHQRSTGRFT